MTIEPRPGLVVRYDYLWKEESRAGQEHGTKDRPCAIILTSTRRDDGKRDVVLCAITHSPPEDGQSAVEIPPKVARYLGLDHERSWIKTHETNTVTWEQGRLPFGITPATRDSWVFGQLPQKLGAQAFEQVKKSIQNKTLLNTRRD